MMGTSWHAGLMVLTVWTTSISCSIIQAQGINDAEQSSIYNDTYMAAAPGYVAQSTLYGLRPKSFYNNVQARMDKDVKNMKWQTAYGNNGDAALAMIREMEYKYSWLQWSAIAYFAHGGRDHTFSYGGSVFVNMPNHIPDRKRVMLVGGHDRRGNFVHAHSVVQSAFRNAAKKGYITSVRQASDAKYLFNYFNERIKAEKKYIKAFAILKGESKFASKYDMGQSSNKHNWFVYQEKLGIKTFAGMGGSMGTVVVHSLASFRVIAFLKSEEELTTKCTGSWCNNHGDCQLLPFSSQRDCYCRSPYYGNRCENKKATPTPKPTPPKPTPPKPTEPCHCSTKKKQGSGCPTQECHCMPSKYGDTRCDAQQADGRGMRVYFQPKCKQQAQGEYCIEKTCCAKIMKDHDGYHTG